MGGYPEAGDSDSSLTNVEQWTNARPSLTFDSVYLIQLCCVVDHL